MRWVDKAHSHPTWREAVQLPPPNLMPPGTRQGGDAPPRPAPRRLALVEGEVARSSGDRAGMRKGMVTQQPRGVHPSLGAKRDPCPD